LQRASAAEGALEAICIKIAIEQRPTPEQCLALGSYRKLYQELRQRIRRGRPLNWDYETLAYQQFKTFAGQAACVLARPAGKPQTPDEAAANLAAITEPLRHDLLRQIGESDELDPEPRKLHVGRGVGLSASAARAEPKESR
ncbi:MAG TPA: hypothetical protein VFJ82_02845, partial [Longimicrobium sp.]|nr:hypothetical protein [Longimicrobium sp.]